MKKLLSVLCALLCVLSLAGCAKNNEQAPSGNESAPAAQAPKTMGDAILLGLESSVYSNEISPEYIKVVTDDYVCESTMTAELYAELDKIDFFAEDKDKQYAEVLKDLPIEKLSLRSESALSEDDMKALVGKKGQEMIDMGFEYYGHYHDDKMTQFFVQKNGYNYKVSVEEQFDIKDDTDVSALFAESTIKTVEPSD